MALSRTNVGSFSSGAAHGTGSFVTTSFTPANNSLLVVCVRASGSTEVAIESLITLAGGGWTYTKRVGKDNIVAGDGIDSVSIWTAPVTTGASMTLTVDCGAVDIFQYVLDVFTYTGYNAGSPIGGTGVSTSSAAGSAPLTYTLSATPAASSELVASAIADAVSTITPGTSWTEQFTSDPEPEYSTETITGVTSTTITWNALQSSANAGVASAAVEILVDAQNPFEQTDWPLPGRGPQRSNPDFAMPMNALQLETYRPLLGQICI